MKIQEFPNCCAISLLSGFGNTTTSFYNDMTKEDAVKSILDERTHHYYKKIQVIVLNEVQLRFFKRKTFKDLGFKIVNLGFYEGHENKIYLLTYNVNNKK